MCKVMLACSDKSFRMWATHSNVGRLITPVHRTSYLHHKYTAMDNSAFSNWNEIKYIKMLLEYSHLSEDIKWITLPDVVGNWRETLRLFKKWQVMVFKLGYKLAFVLQDDVPLDKIPWSDISCVFLGGTTEYKLSERAYLTCVRAKELCKIVHIGRVNSYLRISKFIDVADSFDGLHYSRFSKMSLPELLPWLERVTAEKVFI